MSKCNATIEAEQVDPGKPVPCSLAAGHDGAHTSDESAYIGILWNDSNYGATPHHEPGTPKPATARDTPTIAIQPTGSQFEDWLHLKARAAGWDTNDPTTLKQLTFVARLALAGGFEDHDASKLAAGLGVTEQELRDAYRPEKRQQDIAEIRTAPELSDVEALMDRIVDAGGHWKG